MHKGKSLPRIIIYGDIHGCLEELHELREELNIERLDLEIAVGDVLNKGLYSIDTLRYLRKHNIITIIGNHEYEYIKYHEATLKGKNIKLSRDRLDIYAQFNTLDLDFLNKMPHFLKIKNLTILHAGLPKNFHLKSILSEDEADRLNTHRYETDKKGRKVFWSDLYSGGDGFIVYGHTPFKDIKVDDFSLGIDTGCVYGNKLTAVSFRHKNDLIDVENYEISQIKSKQKYAKKSW